VIRVLVVAEVRLHREGIAALLGVDGPLKVAAIAGSGDDLANGARAADVAVVDVAGEEGLSAVRRVAEVAPLPIVAIGAPKGEDQVLAFAQAGVLGFVERDATVDQLRSGVESVARGEACCPPRIATTLLKRLTRTGGGARTAPELTNLTGRERQIVDLIAEGLSNKEIAHRLCIEVATVKNHVHHILEKLQVPRRADVAALVPFEPEHEGQRPRV
jgi:two-component system nitrate/nitrite response regulator NarL